MPEPINWDTSLGETEKRPPLKLGPIPGVLDYAGHRSPLSRSNTSHKISMALPTPATKGVPRVYHFESAREMAAALEVLLSPDLYELEVQLPKIPYVNSRKQKCEHSFDLRITSRSGFRTAIFVRHGKSLDKPSTQDDINAIFEATPPGFADDKIVVNGDDYTRGYRDNLQRVWEAIKRADPDADYHVLDRVRGTSYWDLGQLLGNCDFAAPRAYDAALRLIGRKLLGTNWHTLIWNRSRVWPL